MSCKLSNFFSSLNLLPFLAKGFSFHFFHFLQRFVNHHQLHSIQVSVNEACTESDQCQEATTQWQGTVKYVDEKQVCRQREVKSSVLE
jgi:hypothetical protein